MSTVTTSPKATAASGVERARGWLSPLNLHFAGVGLLVLVNVYLLAHMAFLWQAASSNNEDAVAQQKITLKTAEVAAQPLRGLDAKLERATTEADRFYDQRLPGTVSEVLAELGALTKKQGVRLIRSQDVYAPVLVGSAGELTEMRIDAGLSGDYRPLMQFINSLERDKMFFVIDSVTLTGQQGGTVNLRLRLKTYLRGRLTEDEMPKGESGDATSGNGAAASDAGTTPATVSASGAAGGSGR
jgi:type IV pilus assembly protein PilO